MNFENIYKENINRKNQEVKDIKSNFILKASINNISTKYKRIILLCSIIIFFIIIITFSSSLKAMMSAFLLFIILIVFSIFFNTYSIIVKDEIITVKTNSEEIKINKEKIKNIYIEENCYRIIFKKRKSYSLIILYETPNCNICDIVLNVALLSAEQLKDWFSTITLKTIKVNNQQKCIKYKRKRLLKKIIIYSIMLILTFIILIINNILY